MESSTSQRDYSTSSPTASATASPSAANISIREYIYFTPHPLPPGTPIPYSIGLPRRNPLNLPETCFEPTSTLVLTSPNNTFVDIRLFKPIHPSSTDDLPNKSEPGRLEWAFAGTSTSSPIALEPAGWEGKTSHSAWTHWLDSRYSVGHPDIPTDQGDMFTIDNALTLEVGFAFHPALGRVSGHEELWRDVPVQSTPDLTPTTTSTTTPPHPAQKTSVTLRLFDASAPHIRGLVVRVGQYCQGIVMQGREVTIERWEFVGATEGTLEAQSEVQRDEEWGWRRTARIGDLYVPCSATFRPRVLSVGGVVRGRGVEWCVEEVWEW